MIIFDQLQIQIQGRTVQQWTYPYAVDTASVDQEATQHRLRGLMTVEEQASGVETYPGDFRWGDIGTNNAREMQCYLWLLKRMMRETYRVEQQLDATEGV